MPGGATIPSTGRQSSVIDQARRPEEHLLKETIHIQSTPAGERLNRDGRKEFPSIGWLC